VDKTLLILIAAIGMFILVIFTQNIFLIAVGGVLAWIIMLAGEEK
jgi:hypothetical protein